MPNPSINPGTPFVFVENLSKRFGPDWALARAWLRRELDGDEPSSSEPRPKRDPRDSPNPRDSHDASTN